MTTNKTVVLISGANQGIGLATATQLARDHGYHVVIGSRNATSGEEIAASLVHDGFSASSVQLDLLSDESIAKAIKQIGIDFGVLDVLINNAGIQLDSRATSKGISTRDLFTKTFDTNVVGAACLTDACMPLLKKSSLPRILFLSSRMGSLTVGLDKSAYDASKAALNMLAVNYARILDDQGGMVNAVCPGLVATNLTNFISYGTTPEIGAKHIVDSATAAKGGRTGTFSSVEGDIPW